MVDLIGLNGRIDGLSHKGDRSMVYVRHNLGIKYAQGIVEVVGLQTVNYPILSSLGK